MELFKLLGTIAIENSEANKALRETSQEGEKTESKLGKVFSSMGKAAATAGKAIAVGLAAGAAAMAGLTAKALSASGELEQNLGGAEQVFKDLGGSISEMSTTIITGYDEATGKAITATTNLETVSKEAYKNMGLSQSDYLATANKMGALFQGAGFETQEALDLSSQAMQRAADVASIMGIDTEAAMEAVAGAAKGNFTMMDNLGVAMNDTAIGAYALEKGINKSTTEMTQQEKIGLAMEMFLEKTSYAAGNYAKENETLAGSLGTAKSALTNFLSGSGDVESLVSSFSNLANVVVNSLTEIAPRLTQGISDLVQQIAPMIAPLLQTLLPVLVDGAVSLVNGLVAALPSVIRALLDSIPALIDGIMQIVDALIGALPSILQALLSALPTLIPQLIDGIVSMIMMLAEMLPQIIQPIIDNLPTIIIAIVQALVNNLPTLIQGLIQLIMGIVNAIPQIMQALVDALPTIVSLLVEALLSNLPLIIEGLIQVVMGIVAALPDIFASLIEGIVAIFVGIWDGIKNVFAPTGDWFKSIFSKAWEGIKAAWSAVVDWFKSLWEGIKNVFNAVTGWFGDIFRKAWEGIKSAWSSVKSFFSDIWNGITNVFSVVGTWFKNIFSKAWDGVKNSWNGVKNFFKGVWDGIKSVFSSVTSWFRDIFSSAWQAVKNVFSSGGEIFSGIVDGVVSTFKTVVNALIDGINSVVSLPFEGLNKILDKLQKISVAGIEPFSWLKWRLPIPEIPHLYEGGVLEKGQVGLLEGNGAEAVVPLENNSKWISKTAEDLKNQLAKEDVLGGGSVSVTANKNTFASAGKTLLQGLWDGMTNSAAYKWLSKNIIGFGNKVLGLIQNSFGIKNGESVVMNTEVGKQLAVGIANGITANTEKVETEADKLAQNILDAAQDKLDTYKTYNDMTLSNEVAFWDAVRVQVAEGTKARLEADRNYFEAKKSLDEQIMDAEATLSESLDEIYQRVIDRKEEIKGTFKLFEEFTEGNKAPKTFMEMKSALDSQIKSLEVYDEEMQKLEQRLGGTSIFEEFSKLGVESLSQLQEINNLSDYQLKVYIDRYNKREELAAKIANDEMADETVKATEEAYRLFAETCNSLGVEVVNSSGGMMSGLVTNFETIEQKVGNVLDVLNPKMQAFASSIAQAFEAALSLVEDLYNPDSDQSPEISIKYSATDEATNVSANVDWHAKSMDNASILKSPTIFGYDNKSGKYLGGGEAGNEVVAGEQTLMNMIRGVVAEQNGTMNSWMQRLYEMLSEYFPQMLGAMEAPVAFDADAMAGALAVPMNQALGKLSSRKDRGR